MKSKHLLLSAAGVLTIIMSFVLGYAYAHIRGLVEAMDMQVITHSSILLTNSITLTQRLESPDMAGLIEATEENGDLLGNFIIKFKPVVENPETRKLIEAALARWAQAKERLQELRGITREK